MPCPLYSCASLRSLAASNKAFLLLIFGLVVFFGSISSKKLKWSSTLCNPPREKSFSYPSFLFIGNNRVHSASLTFPEFHRASSNCCCSVTQLCLTLYDPMDCSMPGFPVLHQLPEFAQTHVHQVSDAIQLSHPLLSPSSPAFNLSPH